jgi:hypothetical protein
LQQNCKRKISHPGATFAYFTAFVAMLVNFSDREDPDWQYWIDANIAAGVRDFPFTVLLQPSTSRIKNLCKILCKSFG